MPLSREARLMTSFMAGMSVDSAISAYALTLSGWKEMNINAAQAIEMGNFDKVLISKMAITAIMIGTYALASSVNSRWKMPIEKAMQIGSLLVWGAVVWNVINYGAEFLAK